MADIAKRVARHFDVTMKQMRGPGRRQTVAQARRTAIYLVRKLTGCSFERIGRYFGGRDHSTVLYAYRKTESLRRSDPQTREVLESLENTLT